MASRVGNLVHQSTTDTGAGNLTLGGITGTRNFSTEFGTGATTDDFYYFISNQDANEWEVGMGHMSDATTLVRDTIIQSSNGGLAVNFSAGTKDVVNDMPASLITLLEDLHPVATSGDYNDLDNLPTFVGGVVFKGVIDCSANPNYPAADAGWLYRVSVAGKIGGASGLNVEVGDVLLCLTDGTASGDQATVGTNWSVGQANIDGAVVGPSSATDNAIARYDSTTGKLIQNSAPVISDNGNISLFGPEINAQTGTTYTLQASDTGKIVTLNNASAITLTLPNSLDNFCCRIVQKGAGQVTLSPAGGATLNNRYGFTKTSGQWAEVDLYVDSNSGGTSAVYVMGGDAA